VTGLARPSFILNLFFHLSDELLNQLQGVILAFHPQLLLSFYDFVEVADLVNCNF
jgi:hypothetical protein